MHTDGHNKGKKPATQHRAWPPVDAEHPGYETTDVNVRGVAVFLAASSAPSLSFSSSASTWGA